MVVFKPLQVQQLPEDDVVSMTRQEMMARLVVAMGGRAAEEKVRDWHSSLLTVRSSGTAT
jgi:hypothetical protein